MVIISEDRRGIEPRSQRWEYLELTTRPRAHIDNIEGVLDIFSKYGVRIKLKKCNFMAEEVLFLGYVIDRNGVRPEKTKMDSILKMQIPEIERNWRVS